MKSIQNKTNKVVSLSKMERVMDDAKTSLCIVYYNNKTPKQTTGYLSGNYLYYFGGKEVDTPTRVEVNSLSLTKNDVVYRVIGLLTPF